METLTDENEMSITQVDMIDKAKIASNYLKAISNETRLVILCYLVFGSKTVTELEELVGVRQANVSQHLARLKEDHLVQSRRIGKTVEYSVSDPDAMKILTILYAKFCAE